MKVYAYKDKGCKTPVLPDDALACRDSGEQKIFYDFKGREMEVVNGRKNRYFRYKAGFTDYGRINKGIVHELFQEILCNRKSLRFTKINRDGSRKNIEMNFSKFPEDEYSIPGYNNPTNKHIVDVMCFPEKKLFNVFPNYSKLGIEVTVTHECPEDKILTFYRDTETEYLELVVPKKWRRVNNFKITYNLFNRLYREISNYVENRLVLKEFSEPEKVRMEFLESIKRIGTLQ